MVALERYLNSFGKSVVNKAKGILKRKKKVVSSELLNSISYKLQKDTEGFTVQFFMANYGTFIDKGVSGTKKINEYTTYDGRKVESPYKFGTGSSRVGKAKGGMSGIMAKWVQKRGFQWKDKKTGRFMSYKSMGYLIARSIYSRGLKSTSFFQRPLQLGMKNFNEEVGEAIKVDILNNLRQI